MKRGFVFFPVFVAVCLGGFVAGTPTPQKGTIRSTASVKTTQVKFTPTITMSRTSNPTKTATATPTATEESKPEDKYYLAECREKAYSQYEMNGCAFSQAENSYQALQQLLKEIRVGLYDDDQRNALAIAQTDWETFRDSDCEFYASYHEGGSIQPMVYYLCVSDMRDLLHPWSGGHII